VNDPRIVAAYADLLPEGAATDPAHQRLIGALDALYQAAQPPLHLQRSFELLLQERAGRAAGASAALPSALATSSVTLPSNDPPIPLPTRPGWRWLLRQSATIAAAVVGFILVGILLVLFFRNTSDRSGMPVGSPVEDTPTPIMHATPTHVSTPAPDATAATLDDSGIDALIAALPAGEVGCAATPPGPPAEGGRGHEIRGRVLAGDPDATALWALYFTLDDESPQTIRANRQVITYWVMDAAPGGTLSMRVTNLDSGLRITPDSVPIEGDSAWRTRSWRTLLTFPEAGCWQVVVTRGSSVAVLWLEVAPASGPSIPEAPMPQLDPPAGPLPLAALRELQSGEALQWWVDVQADIRVSASNVLAWQVAGVDRVLPDGTRQQLMIARDESGLATAHLVSDGERWWWWQRGWVESGVHDTGILAPPEDLQLVESQFRLLRRALLEPDALEIIADRVELSGTDDVRVTRYRLTDMAWLGRDLGIVVSDAYLEVHVTSAAPQNVLRARTVLVAADGSEHVLIRLIMRSFVLTTSDDIDARFFDLPEESPGNALRYQAPAPQVLPEGISIASHVRLFPGGLEEMRLVDASTGDSVILMISPSRGGYDSRGLVRQTDRLGELTVTTSSTRAGGVTWLARPGDGGMPVYAIWDDGRFRFEMSAQSTGWTEEDIVALVEALSSPQEE
jgi:hypothetical protein